MGFKKVPKGYRRNEHPLPHEFDYNFTLKPLTTLKQHTMVTFLRTSEQYTGIEAVEVNPSHANFAEETGPGIANGSIIPKLSIDVKVTGSQALWADNEFGKINCHFMPIYIAFLDTLEAQDTKTDVQVEDILELSHATGTHATSPLYDGNDLTGIASPHPLNTVLRAEVFGDYGLTASDTLEHVNFDLNVFFDALSYYSNASMLRKTTGKMKTFSLSRDRTYHQFSNNFTFPMVKRGNSYTFCGALCWVDKPGDRGSYGASTDYLSTADEIHWRIHTRYDEWNPDFDQTAY